MTHDYLIVGAGPYGCTIAERIANVLNKTVLIIDKRSHIGGNCHSAIEPETGIEYHTYGTHIFHTSSRLVFDYLSRFTEWNGYHHQVLTTFKNKVYQLPINLETINTFYNQNLSPSQAREFIAHEISKEHIENPCNFEEKAISLIGRPLYTAFIRGYTQKQWQRDPKELPPEIINRLPVRYDYREDYFNESRWQGIPLNGYTDMFKNMLDMPQIKVDLDCEYFVHKKELKPAVMTIYTGPIDRYYDYIFGRLDWRSISLEKNIVPVPDFQGTSVMNYADPEIDYTRIHEPRHLHPERNYTNDKSLLFYERSMDNPDEPYYPVNTPGNSEKSEKYRALAEKERDIIIGGRLGSYSYVDMDYAVLNALNLFTNKIMAH